MAREALQDLEEIVTVQGPAFAAAFDYGLGPLNTRAWCRMRAQPLPMTCVAEERCLPGAPSILGARCMC